MKCAWCEKDGADREVRHDRLVAPVHAACVEPAERFIARMSRGVPRVVSWASVRPAIASGYRPTGGRGVKPVDAVLSSRRMVEDDVPTADVIDAVRGGGR